MVLSFPSSSLFSCFFLLHSFFSSPVRLPMPGLRLRDGDAMLLYMHGGEGERERERNRGTEDWSYG
jgi:hypothetical protein